MHQSINKKKIYFYLSLLFIVTTIANHSFINTFKEFIKVKSISIDGLNSSEEIIIEMKLNNIIGKNIFFLNSNTIFKKIEDIKFLQNVNIKKIFPSKLKIILEKTNLTGTTYVNGKKFYIGKNQKLIPINQVQNVKNLPVVFGKFKVTEYLELLILLDKYDVKKNEIDNFFYHNNGRWDFKDKNGLYVMLPSENLEKSIELYNIFLKSNVSKKIKSIDLRILNQISITYENK